MRIRAILNPRAGVQARRALSALQAGRPTWPPIDVRTTEGPGHARVLACAAVEERCEVVLAVGGDGTANEVAWGLLGSETVLGLVPVGSGNGIARNLRIPLRPASALEVLEGGVVRAMDVGLANGRPFLNVAGAGFDALVGRAFHARAKDGGRRGALSYVHLSFAHLGCPAHSWTLLAGSGRFEGRALVIAFMNGRQYGAGAVMAPRARLDDGRVEICVIEDAPRLEIALNAPRLFLGTIERFRRYRCLAATQAVLTAEGPFEHHRDGEPEPRNERLEVRLRPKALRILVPRPTADEPDGPFLPATSHLPGAS